MEREHDIDDEVEIVEDDHDGSTQPPLPEPEPDFAPEVDIVDVVPPPQPAPESPEKKKRDPLKTKFNQVMRERERALDENSRLREELDKYKELASQSSEIAFKNYETVVNQNLANAEKLKVDAYDSGDTEAMVQADKEFNRATYDAQKLADAKIQEEHFRKQAESQREEPAPQYNEQDVFNANPEPYQEWLSDNNWMNPGSQDYDEDLAVKVNQYTYDLNRRLLMEGMDPYQVDSERYLAHLDNHIATLAAERNRSRRQYNDYEPRYQEEFEAPRRQAYPQRQAPQRELRMKQGRQPVAPVRRQSSAQSNGGRPQLTSEEAEHAKYFLAADKSLDLKKFAKYVAIDKADPNSARNRYR